MQAIKIKSLERTKGMVRLRFIAGGRVTAAMGRFLTHEGDLNKASAPASAWPASAACFGSACRCSVAASAGNPSRAWPATGAFASGKHVSKAASGTEKHTVSLLSLLGGQERKCAPGAVSHTDGAFCRSVTLGIVTCAGSRAPRSERCMQALGCGLPGWRRAVQKLQADRKQMKQKLTAYSTEVAQTYALSLLPQLLLSNGWLHAHRCASLVRCRRCRAHS